MSLKLPTFGVLLFEDKTNQLPICSLRRNNLQTAEAEVAMGKHSPLTIGFYRYARVVLVMAILLIWWGAATTTKQAGMAFADWPLSFGSINPDGWLKNMVPFLEHSHRLLATLVGLLVLGLFSWAYLSGGTHNWKRALEIVGLVLVLALVFGTFIRAGAERESAAEKVALMRSGFLLGLIPIGWWIWSCMGRNWRLIEKVTALALLLVTIQAILGGLRVTEISNGFAVIHGCLAQFFFCLLIFIVLLSSRKWGELPFVTTFGEKRVLQFGGLMILTLVIMQLVFGASMRHFHRSGLADHGILKTAGAWIPSFEEPIITFLFLHKLTAFLILISVVGLFGWASLRPFGMQKPTRHLLYILALLGLQIGLGIFVIVGGKHFWITNFHVLNGLGLFALIFVFVIRSMRGKVRRDLLASGGEEG